MSRSRKSSPFVGHTTAVSDKPWKQQNARRVRRAAHQMLDQTVNSEAVPSSRYAKGAADWHGIKDGKLRIEHPTARICGNRYCVPGFRQPPADNPTLVLSGLDMFRASQRTS